MTRYLPRILFSEDEAGALELLSVCFHETEASVAKNMIVVAAS